MQKQTTTRRRSNRSTGDFTGRQKETSTKEQTKEAQSRRAEISMQNAEDELDAQRSVFDPKTGEKVEGPGPSYVARVVDEDDEDEEDEESVVDDDEEENDEEDEQSFGFVPDEPVFTGHETNEEMAPILAKRRERRPSRVRKVRNAVSRIRVDADIEDMTFGMINGEPNNFTFREGLVYKVPTEVADHLDERGLVRQWIS